MRALSNDEEGIASMPHKSALQLASVDELLARMDELERQLETMNSELASLHRLSVLGVLAAGIAHEINNLLTPVLSYAQLALARPDDESLRTKALERTSAGIESVSQIVHAILGMARGEDGQTTANVAAVLDESIRCLGRDPGKDNVHIHADIDAETWVAINPVVLQQVLLNLVLNALKALHGRRGTITISAQETPTGKTTITVRDDGPGIPPDVLPTLFDSPSDAPGSRRKRTGNSAKLSAGNPSSGGNIDEPLPATGTGLGLSICRKLLASENGTITCSSSPNEGATFTIALPSAKVNARKAG